MTNPLKVVDIFRHAQSTSNAGLPTDNPVTVPLTEKGEAQAVALSRTFNDHRPPEAIIVSPYIRTALTAAPTHMRFPGARYMVWPIQEFTYLVSDLYKGTTQEQRQAAADAYWQRNDPNYRDGPGAESFNDLVGRVDDMLEALPRLPYSYSAVFCHGLTMRLIFLRLAEPALVGPALMARAKDLRENYRLGNTECLRVLVNDGQAKLAEPWPAAIERRCEVA